MRSLCSLLLSAAAVWAQASLSGTVVADANNEPVRKAAVSITLRGTPQNALALTDSNGAFRFTGLPAGKYDLYVMRDGYIPARIGAQRTTQVGEMVVLEAGQSKQVAIRMARSASVSGVVLDADGDPVSGAQIQVLVEVYPRGTREFQPVNSAQTDDRGEYEFHDLDPSISYYVAAKHFDSYPRMGVPGGPMKPPETAAQVFYPGVLDPGKARAVRLTPGQQARGIDIRVLSVRAASVKGRVTGVPEGEPDRNFVQISLTPLDANVPGAQQFGGAGPPNYEFTIAGVVPGTYRVVAQMVGQEVRARAIEKVTVREGNEEEITLAMSAGVEIKGVVRFEGDPALKPPKFTVNLIAGDGIQGPGNLATETDEQGAYRIPSVPPGVWDIGVHPVPRGGYVKSMTLGKQDVLAEEMIISPSTNAPLDVVVSSRGAKLEGTVDTDRPPGKKRAWVLVAPVGKFANVFSFYSAGPSTGEGKYQFAGLTPGDYKVYAFDEITPSSWLNPDFLEKYQAVGVPVKLEEGATATAAPRLIEVKR
jgi:hypothetical protein